MGCMHRSVVVEPTTVGVLVGRAGPQPGWLAGPASCRGCCPTNGWGWVSMQQAASLGRGLQGVLPTGPWVGKPPTLLGEREDAKQALASTSVLMVQ